VRVKVLKILRPARTGGSPTRCWHRRRDHDRARHQWPNACKCAPWFHVQ